MIHPLIVKFLEDSKDLSIFNFVVKHKKLSLYLCYDGLTADRRAAVRISASPEGLTREQFFNKAISLVSPTVYAMFNKNDFELEVLG